jgi:hypothetical protein
LATLLFDVDATTVREEKEDGDSLPGLMITALKNWSIFLTVPVPRRDLL